MLCSRCDAERHHMWLESRGTNTITDTRSTSTARAGSSSEPAAGKNVDVDDGEHCLHQSSIQLGVKSVTSEAKTHLASPPNLVQCELLYFVQGSFGIHPESTIKMTIMEFYREDEILYAKQLLVQAAERIDSLNIQSFTKKRSGIHKCRSSVDDIMNIVKLIDEHSCHDNLPIFCAVKRLRVPVIAEELSDMAAVRLELNQLRHHVEKLSKQLSSIPNCHCRSKM